MNLLTITFPILAVAWLFLYFVGWLMKQQTEDMRRKAGNVVAEPAEDNAKKAIEEKQEEQPEEQHEEKPKPKPMQKPKARKKLKYFYKNDEGNVWPDEYWHVNNYIDFKVAGVNFRGDLSAYTGEFMGRLIDEPDNEYDPNAIRVEHQDGMLIGYVPKDMTQKVREFKATPCDCYVYVGKLKGKDGERHFFALCYVTERPFGE